MIAAGIASIACLLNLCPAASIAQTSRPLRIWMDTTVMNVCDQGKTFQLPVYIDDIYYRDSVVGFSLSVWFDKANVELDPIIVASQGTLAYQAKERKVTKDPQQGSMYVEAGNSNLSLIAGSKIPLFYLSGHMTAPDTVAGLNGWIQIVNPVFESSTQFSPIKSDAGLIRVVRDTSAAYTGSLSLVAASFDTLRMDTMTVFVGNVANRGVTECSFAIRASGGYFRFVDTIQSGTLAADIIWSSKDVQIGADSVRCSFVAKSPLTKDGALVKVILRRTTDSGFRTPVKVTGFAVNGNSCLGKLTRTDVEVSAAKIRKDSASGGILDERIADASVVTVATSTGGTVTIRAEWGIRSVQIYDQLGGTVEASSVERISPYQIQIRLRGTPISGVYAAVIRGDNRIVYKQFVLIK